MSSQMQMEPEPKPDIDYERFFKVASYKAEKANLAEQLKIEFAKIAKRSCIEQKVKGQETAITGALRGRVNDMLLNFSKEIDGAKFDGVSVTSTTFLQKEEGPTGSDFVITFEVFEGMSAIPTVSKSMLVQAKTAELQVGPPEKLATVNKDLLGQLKNIKKVSKKGFLMLYTDSGAFVVPSQTAIKKTNGSAFSIKTQDAHDGGYLMYLLAICEGGDTNISPKALNAPRNGKFVDASEYAKILAQHSDKLTKHSQLKSAGQHRKAGPDTSTNSVLAISAKV